MSFPKYPEYKASGVEWLGAIPAHWEVGSFRRLIDSVSNGTTTEQVDEADNTVAVSRIETISGGTINFEKVGYVNFTDSLERFLLVDGDILFSHINSLPMVGNVAIYRSDKPLLHGMNLLRIRPASSVVSDWILYWLKSKCIREEVESRAKPAINQASISTGSVRALPALIPTTFEQTQIARFLDYETAKIDTLIHEQKRLIELLKEKRQAMISHAVTKGLDPDVPMKDSGVEWLGEVPAHWDIKPLRYLGECQNGINIGGEAFGSGAPFVSYGDVYRNAELPDEVFGLVESTKKDRDRYSVLRGDVLFTRTSEIVEEVGFSSTCVTDLPRAVFAGFLIRFRPTPGSVIPDYSKFYFRSEMLRSFFNKEMNLVTRASLSQDLLKLLPVTLPPVDEQADISTYLRNMTRQYDLLVGEGRKSIKLFKERRSALISAAVTGKIDVRDWHPPAYESAFDEEVRQVGMEATA
jgi:type I restriction enzyme S subunit